MQMPAARLSVAGLSCTRLYTFWQYFCSRVFSSRSRSSSPSSRKKRGGPPSKAGAKVSDSSCAFRWWYSALVAM